MTQLNLPKVSIITVVFNNSKHIRGAIESVLSQDYPKIEYIIIDGNSRDGTLEIIEEYGSKISKFISEPDKGIFDALNKGIAISQGDYIGILHSDDLFSDKKVISDIIEHISDSDTELCFSDLVIVDEKSEKIKRYVMAHYFKRWMLRVGLLPPHPTTFFKRTIFDEFGYYAKNYKIAGDFEYFLRIFYGRKIKWSYLKRISVRMRSGGASNSGIKSIKLGMFEINKALRSNNVWSIPFFQVVRYMVRLIELIARPSKKSP